MNKKIPHWLQELKPGPYTLTSLALISKKTKRSLVRTLKNLKLGKEYYVQGEKNLRYVRYFWEGKIGE